MSSLIPSLVLLVLIGGLVAFGYHYLVGTDIKFRPHLRELANARGLTQGSDMRTSDLPSLGFSSDLFGEDEGIPFRREHPTTGDRLVYMRGASRNMFDRTIESIHKYGPASETKDHIIQYRKTLRALTATRSDPTNDSAELPEPRVPEPSVIERGGIRFINSTGIGLPLDLSDFFDEMRLSWLDRNLGGAITIIVDQDNITLTYLPPYYSGSTVDILSRCMSYLDTLAANIKGHSQ